MRPPNDLVRRRVVAVALSLFTAVSLVLSAGSAFASEDDDDDEEIEEAEAVTTGDRQCYAGINFAAAFSIAPTGGFAPGGGARAGCRFSGYFALEFEIDGIDDLAGQQYDRIYGFGANALIFLPLHTLSPFFERVQPFVFGGIDYANARSTGVPRGETQSSPAWSAGTGVRTYLTETIALDLRGKYVNHEGGTRLTFGELDIGFTYDFYGF